MSSPAPPASRKKSLIGSSLVFSAWTLVSRILGFVRDLVLTARLGASAGPAADAFYAALAFPNLFRRLFAEGAFAAAFVPAYARKLKADGEAGADKLASDALATVAAVTVALTVVAQLAMPWIMLAVNPGYVDQPDKFKLVVLLTQITMPYLPCMAIVALLSGVLNARHRFALSAGVSAILNIVTLATVWPQETPQQAALWGSIGVLLAGVAQAGLVWWGARRAGADIRLAWPRLTPEIKSMIALAIPGAIAASATQINIFISGALASLGEEGARAWLNVADRLYQLPLGLVGVAIGVALLPRLSGALQAGDREGGARAMDEALTFALVLTLPAAAALMAMPVFLIDGLFTRGAFTAYDAEMTALALFHYGWGTPAFVLVRVLAPAFFASLDTKTPMKFALVAVVLNILFGVGLFFGLERAGLSGFQGIAAATSAAAWVNVALLWSTLRRRGTWAASARVFSRILRIALAAALMGGLMFAAQVFRPEVEALVAAYAAPAAALIGTKETAVALVSVAGLLAYLLMLLLTGAVRPSEVRRALRRDPRTPAAQGPDALPPALD